MNRVAAGDDDGTTDASEDAQNAHKSGEAYIVPHGKHVTLFKLVQCQSDLAIAELRVPAGGHVQKLWSYTHRKDDPYVYWAKVQRVTLLRNGAPPAYQCYAPDGSSPYRTGVAVGRPMDSRVHAQFSKADAEDWRRGPWFRKCQAWWPKPMCRSLSAPRNW